MSTDITIRVPHTLIRAMSAAWAVFAWATSAAYTDREPGQLDPVMAWLPVDLAWAWAIIALLLTAGAALPLPILHRGHRLGRWCRTIGLIATAGLLVAFAASFVLNGGRGWVSGKNYLWLSLGALAGSWLCGRDHGRHAV